MIEVRSCAKGRGYFAVNEIACGEVVLRDSSVFSSKPDLAAINRAILMDDSSGSLAVRVSAANSLGWVLAMLQSPDAEDIVNSLRLLHPIGTGVGADDFPQWTRAFHAQLAILAEPCATPPEEVVMLCLVHKFNSWQDCNLFKDISYLNHSCRPNCCLLQGDEGHEVRAIRDLEANEELYVTYVGGHAHQLPLREERTKHLKMYYDFECQCAECGSDPGHFESAHVPENITQLLHEFESSDAADRVDTCDVLVRSAIASLPPQHLMISRVSLLEAETIAGAFTADMSQEETCELRLRLLHACRRLMAVRAAWYQSCFACADVATCAAGLMEQLLKSDEERLLESVPAWRTVDDAAECARTWRTQAEEDRRLFH